MVGKKKKSVQILVFIVLIIGAIWAGFPVLWMFSNSFKGNAEIFTCLLHGFQRISAFLHMQNSDKSGNS